MVKTIKERQVLLGVLKVPGTPKSGKHQILAFLRSSVEKWCFPLLLPKRLYFCDFSYFRGAGDLQNTKSDLMFLGGFDHGGEKGTLFLKSGEFNEISLTFIEFH